MNIELDGSLTFLKGVGEKRATSYARLEVFTPWDLINHFPRRYIDLSNPYDISSAPFGDVVPVKARLVSKSSEQRIRKGLSIFKLLALDDSGELEITIFNAKYLIAGLKVDEDYIFFGRIEGGFTRRKVASPEIYPANSKYTILPIYPQTAGITSVLIRQNINQILDSNKELDDPIPQKYRQQYSFDEINSCYRNIHFPEDMTAATNARNRFVFEELLTLSCALSFLKSANKQENNITKSKIDLSPFYSSLPFTATNAQITCINQSIADMLSPYTMNRLIQGDVGSGKTLVASACIYFAYKNGAQSAMMVPTEILAEQHYNTLNEQLSIFGVKTALLTGSTKSKDKRLILEGLNEGEINLCIGTHALLSDNVKYKNLGLIITDEQHRFGVEQRAVLSDKNKAAHLLVMSATPIPRTLSLIIYGDLSVSILDELPKGRKKIDTLLINSSKLKRAYGFVKKHLDEGFQAYFVCPLIEVGEIDLGLKPATEYAVELQNGEFRDYRVGLLHGKMRSAEKEKTMADFKIGKIDLLVSTTVIEVGVDVPNATIMMIQNAERFGLSQIHQLRGRVGRGSDKSFCILISDSKDQLSRQRLTAAKELSDGFELAEYDLKLRGPGDFFGKRQHGLPLLKVADLADNLSLLKNAKDCAEEVLGEDLNLEKNENLALKIRVNKMIDNVGSKPN